MDVDCAVTDRLRSYHLPGEDRIHFAVFLGAVQVTAWNVSREAARAGTVTGGVRCELRPWAISAVEWARTEDAAMFRKWEAALNVDRSGVPIEPRVRRPAY